MSDVDTCPKQMVFGPCGGVRTGGACEIGDRACPFVHVVPRSPTARPAVPLPFDATGDTVIVDVRAPRRWSGDSRGLWRDTASVLHGCVALLGEHVDNPTLADDSGTVPPEEVIEILSAAGVAVVATVTGRDRDLEQARRLLTRFRDAGAATVHCVTGDHPRALGIERPVHFAAESTTLIGVATDLGLAVTVGESPASPGDRVGRVAAKAAAGAAGCILNHAGAPEDLIAFADAVAARTRPPHLFAPVPMVAGEQAALALRAFPGLRLPPGYLHSILEARRPEEAGLRAAGDLARTLLASGRFAGIDLSGGGHDADPHERLRTTARYIEAVRSVRP